VKLFARASKVARIVSLNKYVWTKLKDVGGRGCCLILQEDRTRQITEPCAGPVITACLRIDQLKNRTARVIWLGYEKDKEA